MDTKTRCGLAGKGKIELLENLSRKSSASNGTDRVAGVVSQVELVLVGKNLELVEGFRGEERGGINCSIVYSCNVDKIIDYARLVPNL